MEFELKTLSPEAVGRALADVSGNHALASVASQNPPRHRNPQPWVLELHQRLLCGL